MAKYVSRWWEEDDDNKDNKNQDSTGRRGAKKRRDFYAYDGPELGADTDAPADDIGEFGFSGGSYSSADFRYDDAFDDADARWYRRNSFRYKQRADYSPSSLFRSAWSRPVFDTSDSQNKAIRALRALTRSANTIVDKTKAGQPPVAVQFSRGADSNGPTANLTDTKQRIVYVSPDDLMHTENIAAEDAVIDALTGFVLLRVQMSQDVEAPVIQAINDTGAHMAVVRLVQPFVAQPAKFFTASAEYLHELSAAAVDDYMAGLLAKSMLMGLARRTVVTNWGGFAPYFTRHAKRFETVRENIEKAPLSLEAVVAALSYNMLADENQLPVAEDILAIAAKHLGAEVANDTLLPTCRMLVKDLRELLAKDETAVPGEMETALSTMMKEAKTAAGSGPTDEQKATADFLAQMAEPLLATQRFAHSSEVDRANKAFTPPATAQEMTLRRLKLLQDRARTAEEFVEARLAELANPEISEKARFDLWHRIQNESAQIEYRLNQSTDLPKRLSAAGFADEAKKLEEAINNASAASSGARAPLLTAAPAAAEEAIKKLLEKLKALIAITAPVMKTANAQFKQMVLDSLAARKEAAAEMLTAAETQRELLLARAAELITQANKDKIDAGIAGAAERRLHAAEKLIASLTEKLLNVKNYVQSCEDAVKAARSHNTMAAHERVSRERWDECAKYLPQLLNIGRRDFGEVADVASACSHIHSAQGLEPVEVTQKAIRDDFLYRTSESPASFLATVAHAAGYDFDAANSDALSNLRSEKPHPGLTANEFEDFRSALRALAGRVPLPVKAVELGRKIAEKLGELEKQNCPIDKELFGSKIEVKTKALTGESIGHANDEARNEPEEDYIAYLDENSTRPTTQVKHEMRTGDSSIASERKQRAFKTITSVRQTYRGSIERVRNALQFHSGKRTEETYGLRSGELDEGGLHKLSYDCDHIWSQKTISKLPDVAVGILVDQSGSMCGPKIEAARTMCIVLAEALKRVSGVRLYVYGHTANIGADNELTIYEHYTPSSADLTELGGIQAHSNNYDGYAIKDVAKRLASDPAKGKHLFVIADGYPAGWGYSGPTATKHVTSVCKFVRERLHISLNAFAVGVPVTAQNGFKKQYGEKHVVFIDNVMRCLPQIVRFLRNTLQKEKQLVDVES